MGRSVAGGARARAVRMHSESTPGALASRSSPGAKRAGPTSCVEHEARGKGS